MTVIDRWRGKQRGGESTQGFRDGKQGERSEGGSGALCYSTMQIFIRAIHLFFESWQFFGDIAKYQ